MSDALPEERVSTGIAGLDAVLSGGLRRGRTYMFMGLPGAGKTILANQVCFSHAKSGGRVLYVTLLAESHSDLVGNLRTLEFFDESLVPDPITYVSAFGALEEKTLEGLLELVRKEVRAHRATLLVLDGLVAAYEVASSPRALKKFLHGVQVISQLTKCTSLLLTTAGRTGMTAEHTMVDGLILLCQYRRDVRLARELYVRKFRGSPHLLGRHSFEINARGITVYPRLETLVEFATPQVSTRAHRARSAIKGLDKMLGGGLLPGSSTLLLGNPGGGKTLLGLSFLAEGAREKERSHYFSFYDAPERVIAQTEGVGMRLAPLVKSGQLELSFRPPTEGLLDKLGAELLETIRERKVKRLFVDGYDGLRRVAFRGHRTPRFIAALVNECRSKNVTLLFSVETIAAFGPEVKLPMRGVSMVAENVIVVRSVEVGGQLRRFVSVMKVRIGDHDPNLRELLISSKGLSVGDPLLDGHMLLTGLGRSPAASPRRGRGPLGRRGR